MPTDAVSDAARQGVIVRAYSSPLLRGAVYVSIEAGGHEEAREVLATVCAAKPGE
jgi:hypothetical protein